MNNSASDSTLLPSFDPSHKAASLQGGSHSSARRFRGALTVATQQVSRSWLMVGFSRRRAVDLPEFSHIARTQRTRAPAVASLTALPSHPLRAWRRQDLGGPGFRNGSLTRTSFHHSLLATAARWYVLSVQSLASVLDEPAGPDASPPSYSPTPLELRFRATLRAATVQSLSGGLTPFGCPQACRSRHRFSPLELPLPVHSCARNQYERQPRFPTPQRRSPVASVPSSPNLCARALDGMESSGEGCSPSFRNRFAVDACACEYEHRRSVACRTSTVRCMRLPQSSPG